MAGKTELVHTAQITENPRFDFGLLQYNEAGVPAEWPRVLTQSDVVGFEIRPNIS